MSGRAAAHRSFDWFPAAIVIWATVFNAVLAVVNAQALKLSPSAVIAAESIASLLAFALAVRRHRPEMWTWWILAGLIVLMFSVESSVRGDFQPKLLRDIIIIPNYILLGLATPRRHLDRTVCAIHAIVIGVGLYEALDTDSFAKFFDVQSYYINTRGYDDDNFWNKQSDLFVSAIRPGERIFLPFLNLHRLSSVFLEPVSSGNYCAIITAFICVRYRSLTRPKRCFLIGGNIAVLVGCDGRLAGLSSLVIAAVCLLAPRTPRGTAILYLPLTLIAAVAATDLLDLRAGLDDLAGRIAHTVELLRQYELEDLFALSDRFIWRAADSGIAYLLMTQTIVGFALIWTFVIFGASEDEAEQVRFTHATAVYLSLAMMVSFAILTVKTAGLLWFIQGALQRAEVEPSALGAGERPLPFPHSSC